MGANFSFPDRPGGAKLCRAILGEKFDNSLGTWLRCGVGGNVNPAKVSLGEELTLGVATGGGAVAAIVGAVTSLSEIGSSRRRRFVRVVSSREC